MRLTAIVLTILSMTPLVLAVAEPPIPVGNGFFFDGGELVATVEFSILQGGCNGLAYVYINRHFLGFDKIRYVWADMTCLPDGADGQAWVLIGNEALTPESNLKLAGGGIPGTMVALAGTYRDGYMAVHIP